MFLHNHMILIAMKIENETKPFHKHAICLTSVQLNVYQLHLVLDLPHKLFYSGTKTNKL